MTYLLLLSNITTQATDLHGSVTVSDTHIHITQQHHFTLYSQATNKSQLFDQTIKPDYKMVQKHTGNVHYQSSWFYSFHNLKIFTGDMHHCM